MAAARSTHSQGIGPMSHVKHLAVLAGMLGVVLVAPGGRHPAQASTAAMQADFGTQVAEYVRAQEALADDDFEEAQRALADLIAVADSVVGPLARAAAGAGDIESMRSAFKPLSELLAGMDLPAGYARAYCPMYDGGSNWVQVDGPVRNPYYGSMMLTCGVVDAAPGAHMDHSPRHGGRVFMAPDSFHHIEGTYPEPGIFRLYATDNYREPVDVTMWMGRVVLQEDYDPATDEFIELESAFLLPSPDGAYLEAEVGDQPLPTDFIAKIRMVEDYPEDRFDFIFTELTSDAPVLTVPVPTDVPATLPLAERIRPRIPEATRDIVSGIDARNDEIARLVAEGRFTEIFIPALQSKELALALDQRAEALPAEGRNQVRIAVRSLVRSAWLLDWYGDLGNKQQVSEAHDVFSEAVRGINQVYDGAAAR
ncbi:MAG: DUF3347 domain-containing protein [Acidobacteria bacterium]|nr:DUF3347 domain-containing protein [Chloroflexota bacterium]MYN64862.1 DUF3347 domain-containing protein [Acidobacteriota bacterium]